MDRDDPETKFVNAPVNLVTNVATACSIPKISDGVNADTTDSHEALMIVLISFWVNMSID